MFSARRPRCPFRKFGSDERGAVMVLAAVMLPAVLGMAGLALDVGNLYMTHSKLQTAVDAGALAGSLELPYDPNVSNGKVNYAVKDMVKKNFLDATVTSVASGNEIRSVCVEAEAQSETIFLSALGITPKTVTADACAGFNNLEIVLVIDNTGSMKGSPITNVRNAASDLVDLVLPDGGAPSTKVGLVPFRGRVRMPQNYPGLPPECVNADGSESPWLNDEWMKDEYRSGYYSGKPASYWEITKLVSTSTCQDIPRVQPLTTNKSTILNAIAQMDAQGSGSGTLISEGVKWGRNVLTSQAPFTEGEDPDDYRKVMILLTDGDTEDGRCGGSYDVDYNPNSYWTNAYFGMGDDSCDCNTGGCLDQAFATEAQLTKDSEIEIFTIRYGNSDYNDKQLMMAAASSKAGTDDHYFDAPSSYDIDDIFKEIGKHLGWRLLN